MTPLQEAGQMVALLIGIITVGGAIIGVLIWALRKKIHEVADGQAVRVLELTEKERDAYKEIAARVPELEKKVEILSEQVSGAKLIGELSGKIEAGFVSLARLLEAHEARARRADGWQQSRGDALIEGQNALLANFHLQPPRVTPPPQAERRG